MSWRDKEKQTKEGNSVLMDTWQGAEQLLEHLWADSSDFFSWPLGPWADSWVVMAFIYIPACYGMDTMTCSNKVR